MPLPAVPCARRSLEASSIRRSGALWVWRTRRPSPSRALVADPAAAGNRAGSRTSPTIHDDCANGRTQEPLDDSRMANIDGLTATPDSRRHKNDGDPYPPAGRRLCLHPPRSATRRPGRDRGDRRVPPALPIARPSVGPAGRRAAVPPASSDATIPPAGRRRPRPTTTGSNRP